MEAVLLTQTKNERLAKIAWEQASRCDSWNDGQTKRLLARQADIAARCGYVAAWQYARVYRERSNDAGRWIAQACRRRVLGLDLRTKEGRRLALNVIRNAALMRDGAQSMAIGRFAAETIDAVAIGPNRTVSAAKPRAQETAQQRLIRQFRLDGSNADAGFLQVTFATNRAFENYVYEGRTDEIFIREAMSSIFLFVLPSAALIGLLVGLAILLIAFLVETQKIAIRAITRPWVFLVGPGLGIVAYIGTGDLLCALSVATSLLFLAYSPKHVRTNHPGEFGLGFEIAGFVVSIFLLAMTLLASIMDSFPVHQVFEQGELRADLLAYGPALRILAIIAFSLFPLSSPFWAYTQRARPDMVLAKALRLASGIIFWTGATLAIFGCFASIYLDRLTSQTLAELTSNEPRHYLIHR